MKLSPRTIEQTIEDIAALCLIPSPTGMTRRIGEHLRVQFEQFGFPTSVSPKGVLSVDLGGGGAPIAILAHVDTLGAMVRSILPSGRLRLTPIGGYPFNAIESENCIVHSRKGIDYTGCIQLTEASFHVYRQSGKTERTDKTIEVVLDEKVLSRADTEALGIRAGDFVSFDPRTVVTPNGFIKSRHLDDKAGVGILLALARLVAEKQLVLARRVHLVFATYEEVGHGGATGIPPGVEDVLAVDMGAVGDDLGTNEYTVSICAKDSGGPYDQALTTRLVELAEANGLAFSVDIYPDYRSDANVALRAGYDVRHALIGPGVFASHGYERTHREGIENTLRLLALLVGARG